MAKEYTDEKEELKKGGSLFKTWADKTGITMQPNPTIGNVRFSAIQKGTGGKDFIDVYMSAKNARIMFREIYENFGEQAKRRFEKDKANSYPQAYLFTSGKGGSEKFGLGTGQKGLVFQLQEKGENGKWRQKFVPVLWDDLQEFAFRYLLVTGLIHCEEGYYKDITDAFLEGVRYRDSVHGKNTTHEQEDEDPWA